MNKSFSSSWNECGVVEIVESLALLSRTERSFGNYGYLLDCHAEMRKPEREREAQEQK